MKKILLPFMVTAALGATGCDQQPADNAAPKTESQTNKNNFDTVYNSISEDDIRAPLKMISSDEFEGRSPTSEGEKKTLDYLTSQFKEAGLEPGNGDSFLQEVALMEITANPDMALTIGDNVFQYKENMVASSKREQESVSLNNSELVFVGYGVNAPEYGWNDYEGLDVKGKTVVILVNDPGFENPESGKFQGKTMLSAEQVEDLVAYTMTLK